MSRITFLILQIFFAVYKLVAPKSYEQQLNTPIPNPSSMPVEHNSIFRFLLIPFFKKLKLEIEDPDALKDFANEGDFIYVSQGVGQLEYGYYSHILLELGLPRASIGMGVNFRRWFPLKILIPMLAQEVKSSKEKKSKQILSELCSEIKKHKSTFISIVPSYVSDPALFSWREQKIFSEVIKSSKTSNKPAAIVPLLFIWDKRPKQTRSRFWRAILGEIEQPSNFHKAILFWQRYRQHAVVKIGKPIPIDMSGNSIKTANDLRQELLHHFKAQRRSVTGPPLRPKQWVIDQIMSDPQVEKTCIDFAASANKTAEEVTGLANKFATKMVSDIRSRWLDFAFILLDKCLKNNFEKIDVDMKGIEKLRELCGKEATVIVPNHLSHADYLIISYILSKNNIQTPHVAAGDNLSFWPLGAFLRRSGAYFIPRSLKGNVVYKALLASYLKLLVHEGYLQEFYIEGGRSRTGRLRYPKIGMIKLLSEAADDANKPVHLVPLSITYDEIVEKGSFVEELQGKEKEKETPSHLLKLQKYIKRRHNKKGRVYLRFGDPITILPNEQSDPAIIAIEIIHSISRKRIVTTDGIVALTLLSEPKPAITDIIFKQRLNTYINILKTCNVEFVPGFFQNINLQTRMTLAKFTSLGLIVRRFTPYPYYSIISDKRLELDFFKNTALDALFPIALASKLSTNKDAFEDVLGILEKTIPSPLNNIELTNDLSLEEKGDLELLIEPLLDTTRTITHLLLSSPKPPSVRRTSKEAMTLGKDLLTLGEIKYPESIAKATIDEILNGLIKERYIEVQGRKWKCNSEKLTKLARIISK